ncbi:Ger(x)C family spore germination protein [Paenibacillus humicola]|uniref:Ger(x)C family spore germination protein n=1 Tax=Paenibacillus humicola TaxID=3110540 RepID=UPI00237BB159|nr:Ger(x)C family spore germination protein [Paenibacillus humicola]
MKAILCIGLLSILLIISGCWDRREINDIAFISGSAIDLTDDGNLVGSVQVALPASGQGSPSGGNAQDRFFVLTGHGKNINQALVAMQKKSSRRLFTAHRSVFFISEAVAKRGIKDMLDYFSHDPRNRLKTYMMVVKGDEARNILQIQYPFEHVPIEAVKEMESFKSELAVTLRDFFIASSSEGIYPVMGVIEPERPSGDMKENNRKLFRLAGVAIFKNFKLVGFLSEKETNGFLWVTNKMKAAMIYADMPKGYGNVSMIITHAKRRITPQLSGKKVKIHLQLQGEGMLVENNTPLDIRQPNNFERVQKALEKSVKSQVQDLLTQVQKRYQADILGFGREIYRNQPKQWKTVQEQWDHIFAEADVSITVNLQLRGSGMGNRPLHLNEKEIKK